MVLCQLSGTIAALISGSASLSDRLYSRYRADLWEKAAVIAFVLLAAVACGLT